MYRLKQFAVKYSVIIVMFFLVIMFSFMSPHFLTWRNISNLLNQNTYFIIASVGLGTLMISGGIDLSVGFQMALVGVVTAILMTVVHLPVWAAVSAGLLLGTILGLINGFIIASNPRIFPIIVTIAISTIYQGIAFQITQAKTYRMFPDGFRLISNGELFGLRYDLYIAVFSVLVMQYILKKTYLGRHIMATGGNYEAARLSGIEVKKIRVAMYGVCGFLFALATMDMIAKSNTTNASFGAGTEFTCMTAAIIGGISFKGGKGSMFGLVVGILVLQILGNGMQLAGLGTYSQYIIEGLILLLAIVLDSIDVKTAVRKKEPEVREIAGAEAEG